MNVTSLATAIVGARQAAAGASVAAEVMKMNHEAGMALVGMIEEASAALEQAAVSTNLGPGVGGNLDISV